MIRAVAESNKDELARWHDTLLFEHLQLIVKLAALMRRILAIDVLACPRCQGPMKILAQIHPLDTTRKIPQSLGLPVRPPSMAPARPDPQASLPFDFDETRPQD